MDMNNDFRNRMHQIDAASRSIADVIRLVMTTFQDFSDVRDSVRRIEFCLVILTVVVAILAVVVLCAVALLLCRTFYRENRRYANGQSPRAHYGSRTSRPSSQKYIPASPVAVVAHHQPPKVHIIQDPRYHHEDEEESETTRSPPIQHKSFQSETEEEMERYEEGTSTLPHKEVPVYIEHRESISSPTEEQLQI